MPSNAEFGRRFRQAIAGRTQTEVAGQLGVTQAYVSRMAQGHVPTREIVERLIARLGLDRLEWLSLAGYPDYVAKAVEPAHRPEHTGGSAPALPTFQIPPATLLPTVVDNPHGLVTVLRQALATSQAADLCVGYLDLRAWRGIDDLVQQLEGVDGCRTRLLVGPTPSPEEEVLASLRLTPPHPLDSKRARQAEGKLLDSFRDQLRSGVPDNATVAGLRRLKRQLREGKLRVKAFLRQPLAARLYLTYPSNGASPEIDHFPQTVIVGSSHLVPVGSATTAERSELSLVVSEPRTCATLGRWFDEHWNDPFSRDISQRLADLLEQSWARDEPFSPYLVFLKIARQLAVEAVAEPHKLGLPAELEQIVHPFQREAILRVRRMLRDDPEVPEKNRIALLADVVGMGKTLSATAVAWLIQQEEGGRVVVCCPPKLRGMWEQYLRTYHLQDSSEVIPYSRVDDLEKVRGRVRLVILDESHNLRNRKTKQWRRLHDFIQRQGAKVLLLSATPYNKQYADLANQLRLALDERANLGVRPEAYFRTHSEERFRRDHQADPTTLLAFEQSEEPDDWRELLRHFMVRRTRGYIIDRFAHRDEASGRYFLELGDGSRSYFPRRIPLTLAFPVDEQNGGDQYARLFNRNIVDLIGDLRLPRYGLAQYLAPEQRASASAEEEQLIQSLNQAGRRLLGYCRTNLFKRLESSGHCFLLSLKRHVLRNLVFVHAIDRGLELPIGTQDSSGLDTYSSDRDPDYGGQIEAPGLWEVESADEDEAEGLPSVSGLQELQRQAERVYEAYQRQRKDSRRQFTWISSRLFSPALRSDLIEDAERLCQVLRQAGEWDARGDAKLNRLFELLTGKEARNKVLVFTQFADTADYLAAELQNRGLLAAEAVTAASTNPVDQVSRFSPKSNGREFGRQEQEIRVLVATEVVSEGQNCQDASVVVNYDLPWAIIRLIQRAGRVDRIGQENEEIRIYSCLPAEGVEELIALRKRLGGRLKENQEVIGTDEQFFADEDAPENSLRQIYTGQQGAFDSTEDHKDVDLSSLALMFWESAWKAAPELEDLVQSLPDQVYASRDCEEGQGVLVYFKSAEGYDSLLKVDPDGTLVTRSLSSVLTEAWCESDAPALPVHPRHHDLVREGISSVMKEQTVHAGVLGSYGSPRRIAYERLAGYLAELRSRRDLFSDQLAPDLEQVVDDLYQYPLTQRARDEIHARLRQGIGRDDELTDLVLRLRQEGALTRVPTDVPLDEPRLICSIGLFPQRDLCGEGVAG